MMEVFKLLALLLSSAGIFLSSWIVIPAPNFTLLLLGIGAPEVSPWLLILNAIAAVISLLGIRNNWLQRLALAASLIGLIISVLPLIQLPATQKKFDAAMVEGLGTDYLKVPGGRLQPFVLTDTFRGIDTDIIRYTKNIQFAAPNGVPLSMDIYRPTKTGKNPTLVVLYGGAWQNGSPANNPEFSRYMAARGYTVFAISYRHAPRHRFPAQLEDVRSALRFIQQHSAEYDADPERIALLGRSAGGHLAMLAAYQPDAPPIRAVVNYYGPFNLTQGYREPPNPDPLNVRAVLEAFLGGTPNQIPQQYEKASPISYVTRPLPPTLLVHGSRDHIVEVRFARNMHKRLREANNTSVLLEIPWAEHAFDSIFQGPSNQLAVYYTERFLAWALLQ
jgi:acetyl esterase/lipase